MAPSRFASTPTGRLPQGGAHALPAVQRDLLDVLVAGLALPESAAIVGGEPGAGKRSFARALAAAIGADAAVAQVIAGHRSFEPLLSQILEDLDLHPPGPADDGALREALGRFVGLRRKAGLPTVVIVHDAHVLSAEALSELWTLRGLHLFLFGDLPLLDCVITIEDQSSRTHLVQTVHLKPLQHEEALAYLARLAARSEGPVDSFAPAAAARIAAATGGLAGSIEDVAAACLVEASAGGSRTVGLNVAERVLGVARRGAGGTAGGPPGRGSETRGASARTEPASRSDARGRALVRAIARSAPRTPLLLGGAAGSVALALAWMSGGNDRSQMPRADPRTTPPVELLQAPVAAPVPIDPAERAWVVQVGAFRLRENATALLAKLREFDPDAVVRTEGALFVVVTPPFATKSEARVWEERLAREGFSTYLRTSPKGLE